MIEPGTYRARGVNAALGYTSKGKEQMAVELQFLDGENEGKTITWYGYFTEKTTDSTFDALRVLGWTGADLSDLAGIDANEVSIVVEEETDDEGKTRTRVRWINRRGGIALKERMNPAQLAKFAKRMKGAAVASTQRAKAGGAEAGTRRPSGAGRDEAPPPTDDDIPF